VIDANEAAESRRRHILEPHDIDALYGCPRFTPDEQQLYFTLAGMLTRSEYERKVKEAQQKKGPTPRGAAFDAQEALRLLADIPRLIEESTALERLALVKSLFDRIWVESRRIAKLTPRADVGPVLAALVRVLHGVPDGFQVLDLKPEPPYRLFLTVTR
jgi:hypothetical protein